MTLKNDTKNVFIEDYIFYYYRTFFYMREGLWTGGSLLCSEFALYINIKTKLDAVTERTREYY